MYVNEDLLGGEQAGFREGYNTIDHAFVLHLVIELYQSVRKREDIVLLKLFVLLYADDTIIYAENEIELVTTGIK